MDPLQGKITDLLEPEGEKRILAMRQPGIFFYIYLQNLPKQNIYRTYKNKIFTELTKPKIDFFAKTKQNEDSNLETENLNINNKMRIRTWKVKIKYHQFSSELSDLA